MKRRKSRKITPPPYTPKFQPGDRVRVSAEGVHFLVAREGTMGTVEWCGLVVRVLMDEELEAQNYSPDFWDAVPFVQQFPSDLK